MTLALNETVFRTQLALIWDGPIPSTTIFETADVLEDYWTGAQITGHLLADAVFSSQITYPALSPLAVPVGTPATAAAAFEAAFVAMVGGTTFFPVTPNFLFGPNTPLGPALPGALTSALTVLFSNVTIVSQSTPFANLVVAYLSSWVNAVAIISPPSGPVPIPII